MHVPAKTWRSLPGQAKRQRCYAKLTVALSARRKTAIAKSPYYGDVQVVISDATSDRGERNVLDGEASLLTGFEFNARAVLGSNL